MLRIGEPAPDFTVDSANAGEEQSRTVSLQDYRGRWLMLFFYPRDFSFVCPTELTTFSATIDDFNKRDCDILAMSVDSIDLHREWLTAPETKGGVGPLQFPLGSDRDGNVARAYDVWVPEKQVSTRGMFLIDPEGILQYAVIHNLSVGRTPDEVLRVLDALRTGGLCPASWTSADGTLDLEAALEPGRILGHYRIRKRLGGGAFGSVFSAWDMRLERMVALKVLHHSLLESRSATVSEARAAARLNHPNVCSVYAVAEEDGLPVIVMEYLQGRPLSAEIGNGLSAERALALGQEIAMGLAAAHEQQVVHGDLKPANIMVTTDGRAKILDFGLARSERAARSSSATSKSTHSEQDLQAAHLLETIDFEPAASAAETAIRGTPAYMSPEQAGGQISKPPSDIFSLGLVLFEMLSGRQPFEDCTPLEVLHRLQANDLAQELPAHLEPPYRPLMTQLLQRNPDDRPTALEVSETLAQLRQQTE
jgi:alkyl hydroperoxide reductase subunit AhpC